MQAPTVALREVLAIPVADTACLWCGHHMKLARSIRVLSLKTPHGCPGKAQTSLLDMKEANNFGVTEGTPFLWNLKAQ